QAAAFKRAAELGPRQVTIALSNLPEQLGVERQHFWQACTAVAAQVWPAERGRDQLRSVNLLALIPHPQATRALARVAVFAADESVRAAAIEGLSVRRERDYTAVLAEGLRYPWPAAARNAADAIVALGRKDLAPQLVALLDAPDPRGPRTE